MSTTPGQGNPGRGTPGAGSAHAPWRPLSGIRVIDITSVVMGPFSTQQLADLGADVIVIEDARGDANRSMGTGRHPELSGVALGLMRNKRSVGLNLKTEAAQEALGRLVDTADVLVTNLRPAVRERLGLVYERFTETNRGLIMCSAVGFRPDSVDANRPAYDDVVQGMIAVPEMMERVGQDPTYFPTIFVDKCSGTAIVQAVLAALVERASTGTGRELNLAMYDIMRGFILAEHGADAVSFPGERRAGYERILAPDRAPQPTADGLIAALPYEKHHFQTLFRLAGRDDLVDDPRIQSRSGLIEHRTELRTLVRECLATKTTAEWVALLAEHGVPAAPLATLDDLMADLDVDDHPAAGPYKVVPGALGQLGADVVYRQAPLRWQHTAEVLAELGYADEAVAAMVTTGAAFQPGEPA